ncbi:MAG: hypothetical protein E7088_00935 [Bacteroidales bacterium]|nr:hypothetical protein [Bacteroidales bacterium]
MTTAAELLTEFFGYLNANCGYAVLRNFEGLPEKNNSRDIDIIIERTAYRKNKKNLIALLEKNEWKIITYLNSDRVDTWVCGCIDNYSNTEIVQFDFFFNTSLFGIRLLNAKEFLANREFNGKIYHVNKEYEFLDKYMYDRAVGAEYPEKYKHVKEAVAESSLVKEKLKKVFGTKSIEDCDKRSGKRMLLCAAMHNPIATLAHFCAFEYHRIKNYLCSHTGFSIGFTGPDGSGKTTVIDTLLSRIAPVFRTAHKYYHFRPTLFGNLGEVAHSAGVKKEVDRNYSDPHRGKKTGKASSFLRLCYYSTDYIIGYFVKVKSVTRITRLVIFDRYYTDIICDSRRSRIYLSPKFLYWWGKLFIPTLDYNILLTASSETILARKRELDEEGIKTINTKIDYLAGKRGYTKVLNETTPEEAVYKILNHVFNEQHKKNLKRLK